MTRLSPSILATSALMAGLLVACSSDDTAAGSDAGFTDAASGTKDAASSGVLTFAPSNLGSFLSTVDLSKVVDIDVTGTSHFSLSCGVQPNDGCVEGTVTQADGSTANVYVARSWKIEPGALITQSDGLPAIVVALGTISILGRVDASSSGQFTLAGVSQESVPGPGGGADGVNPTSALDGVGGGGASFCGVGGAGGGVTTATNGAAGKTYGNAALVPLVGGSAGGEGALASGAGGGALELVAGVSIDVASAALPYSGGGDGANGNGGSSASGGGSGGALLFEAPTVTVEGTIAVNGAGGGGGKGVTKALDATPDATAAPGGDPGTTGAGGSGSAGASTAGGAGAAGDGLGGNNEPGAGGGGAGWIRFNTLSGTATLAASATLSPAAGTACTTQGPLSR
jgi:hypothetical protein